MTGKKPPLGTSRVAAEHRIATMRQMAQIAHDAGQGLSGTEIAEQRALSIWNVRRTLRVVGLPCAGSEDDRHVPLRLPRDLYDDVVAIADRRDLTIDRLIVRALESFVDREADQTARGAA
ncbi:hypothetical protein [Chelatococcus asaccharovorans]|uniref:hypothetical protein n=1 Tax=Chelatococcus asaccharovorans TaxID=28210 RepID=UPI00224C64F1|nr:hypothetical protein [Chelatococcus asaccharovorans]CAH1649841.1 hypothetical protein CHELA40_10281 [Chelatococcus asaccharovorans]CAH1686882.1 hypothetical protein CHELA17_65329 [Chelatococcus asaccharovorans]